jgi:predicted unusual protein kinase regulating ubiquinone biosynthesis (AarF/ABC1/UbiB family)
MSRLSGATLLGKYARVAETAAGVAVRAARGRPKREVSKYVCERVSQMGPVFVKFGQILSARGDLIGEDFARGLSLLQDDVFRIPPDEAAPILDRVSRFADVDSDPVAAASLGQVHSARLRATGERVAIKIKRPNIRAGFDGDRAMVDSFIFVVSVFHAQAAKDLRVTMDEFFQTLSLELDYAREVRNMELFRESLEGTPWIRVPRVFADHCDEDVIVMEFVPSNKADDVARLREIGVDCEALSFELMECFMRQAVDGPLFHADPHPGNLGVTDDGQVVLYDYGMTCEIPRVLRARSDDVVRATLMGDAELLSNLMVECDVIKMDAGGAPRDLVPFMEFFLDYTKRRDFDYDEVREAFANVTEVPFALNPSLIMLGRAFAALEGVCVALNPDFNLERVMLGYWEGARGGALSQVDVQARRYAEMIVRVPDTVDAIKRRQGEQMAEIAELRMAARDSRDRRARRGVALAVAATATFYGAAPSFALAVLAAVLLAD